MIRCVPVLRTGVQRKIGDAVHGSNRNIGSVDRTFSSSARQACAAAGRCFELKPDIVPADAVGFRIRYDIATGIANDQLNILGAGTTGALRVNRLGINAEVKLGRQEVGSAIFDINHELGRELLAGIGIDQADRHGDRSGLIEGMNEDGGLHQRSCQPEHCPSVPETR